MSFVYFPIFPNSNCSVPRQQVFDLGNTTSRGHAKQSSHQQSNESKAASKAASKAVKLGLWRCIIHKARAARWWGSKTNFRRAVCGWGGGVASLDFRSGNLLNHCARENGQESWLFRSSWAAFNCSRVDVSLSRPVGVDGRKYFVNVIWIFNAFIVQT